MRKCSLEMAKALFSNPKNLKTTNRRVVWNVDPVSFADGLVRPVNPHTQIEYNWRPLKMNVPGVGFVPVAAVGKLYTSNVVYILADHKTVVFSFCGYDTLTTTETLGTLIHEYTSLDWNFYRNRRGEIVDGAGNLVPLDKGIIFRNHRFVGYELQKVHNIVN